MYWGLVFTFESFTMSANCRLLNVCSSSCRLLTRSFYQKVRAVEERDTYAQFIRTKTHPSIYYQPKEYSDTTKKALKESNQRVNSKCHVFV